MTRFLLFCFCQLPLLMRFPTRIGALFPLMHCAQVFFCRAPDDAVASVSDKGYNLVSIHLGMCVCVLPAVARLASQSADCSSQHECMTSMSKAPVSHRILIRCRRAREICCRGLKGSQCALIDVQLQA